MAKKIINRRTVALVLTLVMCFSSLHITAYAAPNDNQDNWDYAYYLGQEYLGNAPGKDPKPDPVGYGFQGVITSITFKDDAGTEWTFKWSAEANGEWRITGSRVSKAKATAWPQVTSGKVYVGYCGNTAYTFTLSADGSAEAWTYVNESDRHVNWFYYIRFIREYTVNVFYQNETGSVVYNGVTYAAQEPLVRYFHFLYPNGNIIDDSEYEDGEYTDPVTLLPQDYLSEDLLAQGYELKYATDAKGRNVMNTGVTISLLGENILNVYCTLIPPKTENYTVVHTYYTEGSFDGKVNGQTIEVEKNSDFAKIVAGIGKLPTYNGNTYTYVSYTVDPLAKVITLTYSRQLPTYDYTVTYNANFGANPKTLADSENVTGVKDTTYRMEVDDNTFVRENYTFIGWNTKADGTGIAYLPGDKINLTAANNSEVLYAQWRENPKYDYTVIYNANFGSNPDTKTDSVTQTYALQYSFGVEANTFVRENHTFIGWNTEADGGGTAYSFGDVITLTVENNTEILYAQWIENPQYDYVVIYNANFGDEPKQLDDQENVYGTYATAYAIGVDANTFVREYYTFVGWATSPEGEVVYLAEDVISFTEGGQVILYAKWIENDKYSYTLIYNGNGGSLTDGQLSYGDSENKAETYATSHDITVDDNTFVRENYTFIGWNTEADGSGVAYAAQDVVALTAENNAATLYAQWTENPKYDYSVIYNANFGETPELREDGENVTETYAAEYDITVDENTFEREGYTFIGWAVEPAGEVVYQAEDIISFTEGGSATLYAIWQINVYDYTVRYMVRVDGGEYAPFTGTLPEGAPVGGKGEYGQLIDETVLTLPAVLEDETYIYDFTALEGVVIADGENVVFAYYNGYTLDTHDDDSDPTEEPPGEETDPTEASGGDDTSPLADVPKTGDPVMLYVGLTVLSGMGLLGLRITKKKEEE